MFRKYQSKVFLGVLFSTLFITALGAETSHALPLPQAGVGPAEFVDPSSLEVMGNVDFTAIVALSNCSGSLVRFESSLGTDRGMILTNGHCLSMGGFLKPGEVRVNVPVTRNFRLLTSDGKSSLGTLTADRVLYSTMTHTDVTLYQLKNTYDEIERKYSVRALTISSRHPEASRRIVVASGYWKRLYSCSIDRFIYSLHEAGWVFSDSIRYSTPGCETIGGTSGSPIIDAETYEVIGVNNTGNESGGKCTMNNPCEVDSDGNVTVVPNASYGQQTYWFYGCLTAKNELDLAKSGCQLPRPQPQL